MTATFDLGGRVAVVTGALGLLGKDHVVALARAGARVAVTDLDAGSCRDIAEGVKRETGADCVGVRLDVTDPASVAAARAEIEGALGPVHTLVNNAAINDKFESPEAAADASKFENYRLELWRRSLDVNVTGVFLCCQGFGPGMAERKAGSIINIASTYAIVAPDQSLYRRPDGSQPFFKTPSYPATKGAVLQLTRFLAAYWGSDGVRVNALSPGGVEAGQEPYFVDAYAKRTPLGRMARSDDYGGAVVFLASDASGYMTGGNLVVDGGFTAW